MLLPVIRVNGARSLSNTKRSLKLKTPPLNKFTIFHKSTKVSEGRVRVIPNTSSLAHQVLPGEVATVVNEGFLIVIADQPAQEQLRALGSRCASKDSSSLRPQNASLVQLPVGYVTGTDRVRGERQHARGVLLCHIIRWLACSSNPLDVLLLEALEPFPAVFSDDHGEKVCDRIIVVGLGEDNLVLPDGVQDFVVCRRKVGSAQRFVVVDKATELIYLYYVLR